MKKFKVKLEDGTEVEVIRADEVTPLEVRVRELETSNEDLNKKLTNRIEQNQRLETEKKEFETRATTAEEQIKKLPELEKQVSEVQSELGSTKRQRKLLEMYAGAVPAKTLTSLFDIKLFKEADLETDEGVTKLDTEFKTSFPQLFSTSSEKKINPDGGTGGGSNGSAGLVTKVSELKGKSAAEINAAFAEFEKQKG